MESNNKSNTGQNKNKKIVDPEYILPSVPVPDLSQKTVEAEWKKPYEIRICFPKGKSVACFSFKTNDHELYPYAKKWCYVVANRLRITQESKDTLSSEVAILLKQLAGLDQTQLESHIKDIALAGVVEIRIPYTTEYSGWAARVFPWEAVISLLTRPYRTDTEFLTVVRHLDCHEEDKAVDYPPKNQLVVRSGPGELGRMYELESECQMVIEALGLPCSDSKNDILREPNRETLSSVLVNQKPSVVHLSGVDPLALSTYNLMAVDTPHQDGFVLRDTNNIYDLVTPIELAQMFAPAEKMPTLVAISSCFSASRIAALIVAEGARYSIGFLDTISDADARLFFSVFYTTWRTNGWQILPAFTAAHEYASAQTPMQGGHGGVVLWSRDSLLSPKKAVKNALTQAAKKIPERETATIDDLTVNISMATEPGLGSRSRYPSLNYSMLHNDRSAFSSFCINKPLPGILPPLYVEVALELGNESCRCRFSKKLPEMASPLELAPEIRFPLVAGLLRQCTESLRTNLYIKVKCGDRIICERSERINLLPADEWRDDGVDHRWLPSFVLPRDPVVLRIIMAAQRYLRTLLDDCTAQFDGYQQLLLDDSNAPNIVDPQVQAIWAALQHDMPLNYLNPPPSYSSRSQRLRSPTQIFNGNAATCIDLALLFASCLEFIGIYPVIFLISGHAFPGYWRTDKAWWRMREFRFKENTIGITKGDIPLADNFMLTRGQTESWMFEGIDNLKELLGYVQTGVLIPFEGTYITNKLGFFASLEAGVTVLHPDTFDAMIEIQSARAENVTPLSLIHQRESP